MKTKVIENKKIVLRITFDERLKNGEAVNIFCKELKNSLLPIFNFLISLIPRKKEMVPNFPLSIDLTFCGDGRMKELNTKHRQKKKTTDVLSFPQFENLRGSSAFEQELTFLTTEIFLGDIVISLPVAFRQSKEFKLTLREEIWHLFVHGTLHLLGYDHEISPHEEKIMFSLEEMMIQKIVKNLKNKKR